MVAVIAAATPPPVLINLGPKSNGVGTSRQITLNACVGLTNLHNPSSTYTLGTVGGYLGANRQISTLLYAKPTCTYLTSLLLTPLSLLVCLFARHPSHLSSLLADASLDYIWLSELEGYVVPKEDSSIFLKACFADYAQGYVLYDYEDQKALIPNVLTYAAVAGAVPINKAIADEYELGEIELVQDLTHVTQRGGWKGLGAIDVTEKMWEEVRVGRGVRSDDKFRLTLNLVAEQRLYHRPLHDEPGVPSL